MGCHLIRRLHLGLPSPRQLGPPARPRRSSHAGGVAVLRGGLKKGSFVTVALTLCRTASTVSSIWRRVPGAACSRWTLASAIIFLSSGDQVVEVALPTRSRAL